MTVVGVERGICGKADRRVIQCVQFSKSILTCKFINSVTSDNGHFDESEFSRRKPILALTLDCYREMWYEKHSVVSSQMPRYL